MMSFSHVYFGHIYSEETRGSETAKVRLGGAVKKGQILLR
jgi:hypothetical protein